MRFLFDDRLAPLTSEIGFIESDYVTAFEAFSLWQQPLLSPYGIRLFSRTVKGNLESVLKSLLPLAESSCTRYLFIPTANPKWSVFLDNGWRGTNADTVAVIAARLRCYAIRMAAIPNTINRDGKGRYGACMFVLFGPRPENSLPHNCIRSITAANDGGKWVFDTYGLPLPFENAGQYLLKRVRDKFTFEMLEEYLAAMSLFPFDESFYLPPGNERAILATTSAKFRPDARDISLEEARAGY